MKKMEWKKKLYKKLNTLFKEDRKKSSFIAYERFKKYQKLTIHDHLIEFECLVARLRNYNINL